MNKPPKLSKQPKRNSTKSGQMVLNRIITLPLHPFLFASWFILAPLLDNIAEVRTRLATPILLSALVSSGFIVLLINLIFKNWFKSSLITTMLVLSFWGFGYAHDLILSIARNKPIIGPLAQGHIFIPAIILLIGFLSYKVIKSTNDFKALTVFLNVVALVLVLFNATAITAHVLKQRGLQPPVVEKPLPVSVDKNNMPDIYYILADDYAGNETLKKFGFDNLNFLNYLRNKNFKVYDNAYSNYQDTIGSLASMLNMRYLDQEKEQWQ